MFAGDLYKEGNALQDKLEVMRLADLLALNPTLQQMRQVWGVMMIGHGKDAREVDVEEVRNLLQSKIPEVKLQDNLCAEAGKFRVILMIDSEKYQLGGDQATVGTAFQLFKEYGKEHPCCVYDNKGELKMRLA
jgi:hypothetical protein